MSTGEDKNREIANAIWECRDMFRAHFDVSELAPYANLIAYVAVVAKRNNVKEADPLQQFKRAVVENVGNAILRDYLLSEMGEFWQRATNLLVQEFTEEDLAQFALTYDFTARAGKAGGENITPSCICDLALKILDIGTDEVIADLGCGGGNFLEEAVEVNGNSIKAYGIDRDIDLACLAIARMELLKADYLIEIGDVFEQTKRSSFDKVFTNYPFGMRIAAMKGNGEYYEAMKTGSQGFGRPASADWIFNKVAFDSLKDGGTAVAVMTNGAAFNGGDRQARKYFVDNGMIKAVIALPSNLFASTAIPTTLIVLGKNDGEIRMVDATDLAVPGRRRNTLGTEEISEVLDRLVSDGESSTLVSIEDIANRDYNLYPTRYLARDLSLENPTKLGDLAISIERGARIPAQELDELTIDSDSRITYLRLSDINDGRISNDRPRLRQIDHNTERYWLKTGDLIVSKNGAPFKIAVAEIAENDIVLANGNLYIIRLNTDIVDPYFAAAFLSSDDGKEALERYVVGTAIPNLPLKNLKELLIPVPPMKKQQEIASAYRASLDEIEILKIKLAKARVAMSEAYMAAVNR